MRGKLQIFLLLQQLLKEKTISLKNAIFIKLFSSPIIAVMGISVADWYLF